MVRGAKGGGGGRELGSDEERLLSHRESTISSETRMGK